MFTTQDEVIEWIQSYQRFGMSPGLERVQWLLEQLGNPQKKQKIIHVAGTNGKGSTCKFIASALEANGYRVGLFTSPYLDAFNNRIAINQADINQQSLCLVASQIKQVVTGMPEAELGHLTEFELITVMALLYYSIENIDFIVLEVGLGGRLDATNVVDPLVSIITNIGYDHIHILGSRLSDIAAEKAGIIKEGIPVISGVQNLEAANVIRQRSKEKNSKLYELGSEFHNKLDSMSLCEMQIEFTFHNEPFLNTMLWKTQLVATYQATNLSFALAALKLLAEQGDITLNAEITHEGIQNARWPGRFEVMQENPIVIVDGAHNPEGFEALIESLEAQFGVEKKYVWCIGFLQDKEFDKMIQLIINKADTIVITEPMSDRRATTSMVEAEINKQIQNRQVSLTRDMKRIVACIDIEKAVEITVREAEPDDVVCIAGSLYMIAEARNWWANKEQRLVKE